MKNYYHVLGLESNANKEEIKKSYRLYTQKLHPDKQKGDKFFEERFKEIVEAYENLIDDDKRKTYDSKLLTYKSSNDDFFRKKQQDIFSKENDLMRRESLLQKKQKEVNEKENELEKIRVNNEKVRTTEFQEREKKVYLKKGNIYINGNVFQVDEKKFNVNEILTINQQIKSNKNLRITGYFLLFLSIFTLIIYIGFLFLILGLFLIFKKDTVIINLIFIDSFLFKINSSEIKFSNQIVESINKALEFNRLNYPYLFD